MDLIDCGYDIEYKESIRSVLNHKTGVREDNYLLSDFYLVKDFTDGELRLLIDSLLFSNHIDNHQRKELVRKLENLSNVFFKSHLNHICTIQNHDLASKQLFYTIEILDEAISKKRKVSFQYCSYGLDKVLHPRECSEGGYKEYIVSPYQIAATNGRYYLIANTDPHDNISHYRLDRIVNIQLTEKPTKKAELVQGMEHGIQLPKHMAEHVYMFSGESASVTFRMKTLILNDVIDWFGTRVNFFDPEGDEVTARVTVNLQAMQLWALQYSSYVRVLEPKSLQSEILSNLKKAVENYEKEEF
ncbi:MAG: WYL domain-containing protein [Faecalicoccus sp.]|nr:WYL domain-containing protein [Faecalicoccus sp.]